MGAMLRGVSVRIEDGFYYFGSRKYVREACPLTLRTEIETAIRKAAATADPKTTKGNKRAKSTTTSTSGNYGLSAAGRQPRQRKN